MNYGAREDETGSMRAQGNIGVRDREGSLGYREHLRQFDSD